MFLKQTMLPISLRPLTNDSHTATYQKLVLIPKREQSKSKEIQKIHLSPKKNEAEIQECNIRERIRGSKMNRSQLPMLSPTKPKPRTEEEIKMGEECWMAWKQRKEQEKTYDKVR